MVYNAVCRHGKGKMVIFRQPVPEGETPVDLRWLTESDKDPHWPFYQILKSIACMKEFGPRILVG